MMSLLIVQCKTNEITAKYEMIWHCSYCTRACLYLLYPVYKKNQAVGLNLQ